MSQHIWTYKNYEVLTGWDRPLQRYFLVISLTDIPEDDDETDEYVFSNLRMKNASMTLEEICKILERLNIPYPDNLRENLEKDEMENARTGYGSAVNYGELKPK